MAYEVNIIEGKEQTLLADDESQQISVCAYCRVSTDKNDQRNSYATQKRFFEREFSKHKNWVGKEVFADQGISGTSLKKRDEFNRMIELARRGVYQLIITKDVTRFSRNVENTMSIVVELQKKGVYIIFLSDDINTQRIEDRDKLTAAIKQAEGESLKLSKKVRWGQQASMEQGVVFGRKEMYGYNIVRDPITNQQHFVIIPEEASVVKKVFQMYSNGMGTFRIAKQLERENIQSKYKNGWSNTVILRMLRNEKYVGDLYTGKTYTPDPLEHTKKYNRENSIAFYIRDHHPDERIIDRELWDRVQELLKQNAPSDEIKKKHSNRYWCSGKVFCGECGERYISRNRTMKSGKKTKTWNCWANQQRGTRKEITLETGEKKTVGCSSHSVNERILKQGMYDIITQYIQPNFQQFRSSIIESYQKRIQSVSKTDEAQIEALETQIATKKAELVALTRQNLAGIVDNDMYMAVRDAVNAEITELAEKITKMKISNVDIADATVAYQNSIEMLDEILDLNDDTINENLYRRILERIEVYNNRILKYYFKFLSNPVILQHTATGRGTTYSVVFEVLTPDNL